MELSSSVLAASQVWLDLLTRNNFAQAQALIRHDPARVGGFTSTQYERALAWLRSVGLLVDGDFGPALTQQITGMPAREVASIVFETAVQSASPTWLRLADEIVQTPDDVPVDAGEAAYALGLTSDDAFIAVRRAHRAAGKVDAQRLATIGEAGEQAVLSIIRAKWPMAATQVSAYDDSAGYDIVVEISGQLTRLEVKTTTSRARLVVHLSRNEYEACLLDPAWRLVVVGLDELTGDCTIASLLDSDIFVRGAPRDLPLGGRWESARYTVPAVELTGGLCINGSSVLAIPSPDHCFEWSPRAEIAERHHEECIGGADRVRGL